MNGDVERELRERLRSASLPTAPTGLQQRLESVVASPTQHQRWRLHDRPLLAPVVAGLLVVALAAAALSASGILGPDATPIPSAVSLASESPIATPASTDAPLELPPVVCPDGEGVITCEQASALALARLPPQHGPIRYVKVTRPPRACRAPSVGATCTPEVMVEVVFADPRVGVALVAINRRADGIQVSDVIGPPPPEVICDQGLYPSDALTCDRAIDAAMSQIGTDHPRLARIIFVHSCSDLLGGPSDCAVHHSGIVSITYDSSPETTTAVFVKRTGVSVDAEIVSAAPLQIQCSEAPEPARTCAEIVEAVLAALGPNHPPMGRLDVPDVCRSGLIPSCRRADWVVVTFAGPRRLQVRLTIRETPSGAFVEDPTSPQARHFKPPYSAVAPVGDGPWIWLAKLGEDRRTLTIDFFATAGPPPCGGEYEPWVGRDGDNLVVKIVRVERPFPSPTPSPTPALMELPRGMELIACPLIGTSHRFEVTLPETFVGTAVRDLNGGILVLAR